jgi:DNA-binding NtrC family response regulator
MQLKRVLVIDHTEKFRNALIAILNIEGFHAIGAGSFTEAADMLKHREVSLVLLTIDTLAHGENGRLFEYFKRHRQKIPVVIMSDQPFYMNTDQSFDDIAHDFIQKPLQIDDIKKIVRYAARED